MTDQPHGFDELVEQLEVENARLRGKNLTLTHEWDAMVRAIKDLTAENARLRVVARAANEMMGSMRGPSDWADPSKWEALEIALAHLDRQETTLSDESEITDEPR